MKYQPEPPCTYNTRVGGVDRATRLFEGRGHDGLLVWWRGRGDDNLTICACALWCHEG